MVPFCFHPVSRTQTLKTHISPGKLHAFRGSGCARLGGSSYFSDQYSYSQPAAILVSIAQRTCASAGASGGHLDNCKMHCNAFCPRADVHVLPHRNKDGGLLGMMNNYLAVIILPCLALCHIWHFSSVHTHK
jgi:hypothetical protein